MKSIGTMKKGLFIIALALACATVSASAQHRRGSFRHAQKYRIAVVSTPAAVAHVNNRFSQKERLEMAIAYLKNNQYLKIKKYAQITGLSKETAEAELDAFAADPKKGIVQVIVKKKKVYTLIQD